MNTLHTTLTIPCHWIQAAARCARVPRRPGQRRAGANAPRAAARWRRTAGEPRYLAAKLPWLEVVGIAIGVVGKSPSARIFEGCYYQVKGC